MISALRSNSFFTTYIAPITNALGNLSLGGKIASVAVAVLAALITIPVVYFFKYKSVKPLQPSVDGTAAQKTAAKIEFIDAKEAITHMLAKAQSIAKHSDTYLTKEIIDRTTELDLDAIAVTPKQLAQIAATFSNISKLTLTNSSLSDEHLQTLAGFTSLKHLDLSKGIIGVTPPSKSLSDDQLIHFKQLNKLSELNLKGHSELTGKTFAHLPVSLTFLGIQRCTFTDDSLKNLKHLTALGYLSMSYNNKITGSTFSTLPKSLDAISAAYCALNDAAIAALNPFTKLAYLDVSNNKAITDKNLDKLPSSITNLDLGGCDKLTVSFRDKIKHLTNIKELELP